MRTTTRWAVGALAVGAGTVLLRPGTRLNRCLGTGMERAGRRLRYAGGRLQGLSYHLEGRHPDPNASDDIVADRVRSAIGGLEKQLDLPHVHVLVERHVALLHGDVGSEADARAIERAVAKVWGVRDVDSHLQVGLIAGDTRPSQGRG